MGNWPTGATVRKFRIVRIEGKRDVAREIGHYNLEAVLAVGFSVRSHHTRSSPPITRLHEQAHARGEGYEVRD
ncbi:MAG: virulence RhuM family protein [Candidatus Synoicihabitans palmerolidicus]|nr:virulence RhuM family protein [Candidatus Synoicihabitans palmerolidicus]